MHYLLILLCSLFFAHSPCDASSKAPFKLYAFESDPIDVIIPSIEKDLDTLDLSIKGILKYGQNVRRVIVISSKRLTDEAEWFDESLFPFTKLDVATYLQGGNPDLGAAYLKKPGNRVGWYYQQLLKLYAPFVIPGISPNVLALDSDTIFFKNTSFINANGAGLYNPSGENTRAYFNHINKLTNNQVKRYNRKFSGVAHHMLFQRCVLQELFSKVENLHQMDFWKSFLSCVNPKSLFAGASEYELYFNYVFSKTKQVEIRELKWANGSHLEYAPIYKLKGYHYASFHSYLRK